MKIYNREDFLKLPAKTLYCTVKENCGFFENPEIKNSDGDFWNNTWIQEHLFTFLAPPFNECGDFPELGDSFKFDEDQTMRDSLYSEEDTYAVFDNDDINQLVDKLKSCLK